MPSRQQLKRLQLALIKAFPSKSVLERLLYFELEKNLNEITKDSDLQEIVFKLIQTAESQGWLIDLVRAARQENPGSLQLEAIARELLADNPTTTLYNSNKETDNTFDKNTTISILFVVSHPAVTPRLRLENKIKALKEKLQISVYQNRFLLHQQEFLRPEDLFSSLIYIKPNIIHFVGGAENELGFVDKFEISHPIPSYALSAIFENLSNQVKCVVLEDCYSESQARAISQHIEYVIGLGKINDKTAIEFISAFYQALEEGYTIEEAYARGKIQINFQDASQIPVLLRKMQ